MRFAHFFIDRPVFAGVISIVLVIVGLIALYALPIAEYPEIAPPTVTVTASYPGADAQVVADTVSTPIEEQINGVENMLYMSSQCGNDGSMRLTVTFKLGTNLDIAQVQVQNRIAMAEPQLPADVRALGITVRKASPDITLVVQLYSPDNRYDSLYISNFALIQVRDPLARLPGVGDISIFGERDYSMRLWLDPGAMAALGVTVGDVVQAVQEQNVQVAAGTVGGPPVPPGAVDFQLTVKAQGRLTDPKQFAAIIVKTGSSGQVVRVGDIARTELGAADYSLNAYTNGKPSVGIPIFQLPGTNAIATADAVYAQMKEMRSSRTWPPGLEYAIPYDTTIFVRESLRDVVRTLLEALGLVVLVVLVFLQNWRASIIPLLAIPVSLIGTCAVMKVLGFSLNTLSLFGMVLAIGIVVDDAIVVVENIERWLEQGLPPREAAYRAMDEVTGAVIAIAFGLSAVFVPVAFVSGITGQFYRQFALTIAISTLLSAFNSLTLSPALGAVLLRPVKDRNDWLTRLLDRTLGWFFRLFNRGLARLTSAYVNAARRVLRFSGITLLIYAGLVFLTYVAFRKVPTGFIPQQDLGYLMVNLQLPDAASLDRTDAVLRRMADKARAIPGVHDTFAITGFSLLTGTNESNFGAMFVILDPFERRTGHPELSGNAILARLSAEYARVQEGVALVLPPPPVRGIGRTGGFRIEVEDRTGLHTPQQLGEATQDLLAAAQQDPRLTGLFSSFRPNVPELYVNIDRTQLKAQNVRVSDVFQTLQGFLGGLYINDFNFLGRTYRVIAQAQAHARLRPEEIIDFQTRNAAGQMVPLGAVAAVQETTGPDRINRYNLYSAAEINGSAAPGASSGQAIADMERLAASALPPGYSYEWTELAYQEKIAGNTAIYIFPLCVLFVFLTHSAEYESFSLATAIILIVPMCLLCGIAGVMLRHMDNNIFTQIGFVVLAGLSVKNAVLIVEFATQQQEQGKNAVEAALEAARLRLRPILMTSFAFILGVVPLVFASGAGAELRQTLGTVVFFGMIGVTFFGLFLTPVFFVVIRRLTGRTVLPPDERRDHGPPGTRALRDATAAAAAVLTNRPKEPGPGQT
ncbi:MAG: transporter, hydrophobe/amphiphile efflux family [Phycisphaerales bacterium]|nr:transporter, hydrophobe/amphiphile efflux family [Phycisphaerales bacterium]